MLYFNGVDDDVFLREANMQCSREISTHPDPRSMMTVMLRLRQEGGPTRSHSLDTCACRMFTEVNAHWLVGRYPSTWIIASPRCLMLPLW